VTPQLELPARPAMLPVKWLHEDNNRLHILTNDEARKLLVNISRLWAHIEILEGIITAVGGTEGWAGK
jgi:hypothetical protein